MTEKEAYERIGIYVVCGSLNTPDGQLIEYSEKDIEKDLDTLKKLVEKATPKKVVYAYDFHHKNRPHCPKCNHKLIEFSQFEVYVPTKSKYCPHCVQALDWSNQ